MSSERSAFKNGIWLCRNCAALIDRDVEGYPVEKLMQWKRTSEARALLGINKPPPGNVAAMLPLSGAVLSARDALSRVGTTMKAIAQSLEALDPRFRVNIAHDGSNSSIRFEPVSEPVRVSMNLRDEVKAGQLMVEGQRLAAGRGKLPMASSGYGLLDFVDELRLILLHSPIEIIMPTKLDITADDIGRVHGLASLRHASAGSTMSATVIQRLVVLGVTSVELVQDVPNHPVPQFVSVFAEMRSPVVIRTDSGARTLNFRISVETIGGLM